MLSWLVAGVGLVVALLAWRAARKTAARVDQLTQMVWALRYQLGELRTEVERGPARDRTPGAPGPAQSEVELNGFVPISSLKKK